MVKAIREENHFQCEECNLKYSEKEWAEKCEAWCREHQSCNLEITSNAVENKSP
jgi:hypothetical protein